MSLLDGIDIQILVAEAYYNADGDLDTTETIKTIKGSVFRDTGKYSVYSDAGRDDAGRVRLHTKEQLKIGIEKENIVGDKLIWNGFLYELIKEYCEKPPTNKSKLSYFVYTAEYRGVYNEN